MKKLLGYFNGFEWFLIIGMIIANGIAGGLSEPIGAICAITGVICVVLVAKGKISNFAFGLVNVVLYAYIAYASKFYGEVMLNVIYYLPIQFFGYFTWKKNMSGGSVTAKKMSGKELLGLAVLVTIAVYGYAQFLIYLGGNSPYLDSTSTVLSVVAQLLMLAMFAEQWLLWIIVNIVSVALWVTPAMTGDSAAIQMVIMWSAYLINAIYGYWNWKRMAKEEEIRKDMEAVNTAKCPYKI